MKQDAINDTITIVVEPGNERSHVLAMLERLAGQRVIVALANDAVFRRPGDLRELRQAAAHVNVELILVIANNKSLRLWARGQGFTVFSSLESYVKAQQRAQQPASLPLVARPFFLEEQAITGTRSSNQLHPTNNDNELQIEDVSEEESYPLQPIVFPKPSGQFKVPGVPVTRRASRVTEPLYIRLAAQRAASVTSALSQRDRVDTPADVQLIDVQKALYKQIAEEKAQDCSSQPFSLLSSTPAISAMPSVSAMAEQQPLFEVADLADLPTRPTRGAAQTIWPDRFLFVLVGLLVLGIMGGVGFAYLLALAHGIPATIVPAALTPGLSIYQVVL